MTRIYRVRNAQGKVIAEIFRPTKQPRSYGFCLRMDGVLWGSDNEPARSGFSMARFKRKRDAVAKAEAIGGVR